MEQNGFRNNFQEASNITGTNLDRIEEILSDAENNSNLQKTDDEIRKDKESMEPINVNYSKIDDMREEAKFLNHEKMVNINEQQSKKSMNFGALLP